MRKINIKIILDIMIIKEIIEIIEISTKSKNNEKKKSIERVIIKVQGKKKYQVKVQNF